MAEDPKLLEFAEAFESKRLLIRASRAGDGLMVNSAIHESAERLQEWMPWAQTLPTPEESEKICIEAAENFQKREDLPFFLFQKDSEIFVGASGLHRMDWTVPRFEIGYWVRSSESGKGYMTEAVHAITSFAFQELNAKRIEIHTDTKNKNSWAIPERIGFVLEGILKNHKRDMRGKLRDTRVYAVTDLNQVMPLNHKR